MKSLFKIIVVKILEIEARLVLKKYKPRIVAVTGSVGKTTTKDAIYSVLASGSHVRKSAKSFNSDIGVPLTILGFPNAWSNPLLWLKNIVEGLFLIILPNRYPEILVLEIGADRPGDIERITKWIKPDVAVITRMGKVPVHVEFFPTIAAVRREKGFLALAVKKGGTLVLNGDDDDANFFASLNPHALRILRYGFDEKNDVYAREYAIQYAENTLSQSLSQPNGISFTLAVRGGGAFKDEGVTETETARVSIVGSLGRQHVYSALGAAAAGVALGVKLPQIAKTLKRHATPPGRMRILSGIRGSVIIDDTYNSSPVATLEALETLQAITTPTTPTTPITPAPPTASVMPAAPAGRKIVALGDMLELGEYSAEEHRTVGKKAAEVAHLILTAGMRAKGIAEGALSAGFLAEHIRSFEDSTALGEFLKSEIKMGDVVLCKGSQGTRMEKAVAMILEKPQDAKKFLVRQDEEWQKR